MKYVPLVLISLFFGACAEAQHTAEQIEIHDKVDKLPAEEVAAIKTSLPKGVDKNYSKMTREELLAEIEINAGKIAVLEVGIDSFRDDDPRWDELDELMKIHGDIRDAQLEQSAKRVEDSCRIVKALGGACAE